ncbi:MAG: DUF4367 domain-containing protein [Eubacterium sp.]|nr:DUF4367 domain-containing protein [Eubacterium sp.]
MCGNFDKILFGENKLIKAVLAVVFAFAVINMISVFLTGTNIISGLKILNNKLNLRHTETEITDLKDSGFTSYSTIGELEEKLGVKFLLPEYLPEDYRLDSVSHSDITGTVIICFVSAENDGAEIKLVIRLIEEGKSIFIEKDDTPVYTVTHKNTAFNVMSNNGRTVIEWVYNGYSYMITGILNEKQAKQIVRNLG